MTVRIRAGMASDAPALAALFRHTRSMSLPYLPKLHTPDEDRTFFESTLGRDYVFVAEYGEIVGFIASRLGWIDHLYVDPAQHGAGIGTTLLRKVLADQDEVRLWTFQRNRQAICFYERRGFVRERTTEGENEEREPDALYVWRRLSEQDTEISAPDVWSP